MSGPLVAFVLILCFVVLFIAAGGHYALRRVWRFQHERRRGRRSRSGLLQHDPGQERKALPEDLRDTRDFAFNLQLGTSMEATLSGALEQTAHQFASRKGIFGERLKRQVDAKLASSPEDVIQGLAEDFDSSHLRELLERLIMAREGGVSYERALSISVNSIEEDIRSRIEMEIQEAPTKLTIPMVVGIFGPPVMIGMLPLIAGMLRVLSEH